MSALPFLLQMRRWILGIGAILVLPTVPPALAQDAESLYETCFARRYDSAHLSAHPGQRVVAVTVYFQNFADTLLAGVSYTLRYGDKFGISGDCYEPIEGGFLCNACASDTCESNGETFKVLWSGGDSIELVNDTTGVVGENPDGGRDYLRPGGEHKVFVLNRGTLTDCAW